MGRMIFKIYGCTVSPSKLIRCARLAEKKLKYLKNPRIERLMSMLKIRNRFFIFSLSDAWIFKLQR